MEQPATPPGSPGPERREPLPPPPLVLETPELLSDDEEEPARRLRRRIMAPHLEGEPMGPLASEAAMDIPGNPDDVD